MERGPTPMKLARTLCRGTRGALCRIHLVDKCLILFMLVLLLQSAYTLFSPYQAAGDAAHIDMVMRTASASIFGYFLSANFIRHAAAPKEPVGPPSAAVRTISTAASADVPRGRIGFALPEDGPAAAPPSDQPAPPQLSSEQEGQVAAQRLQVLVAAGIGLFSLVLLILLRDMEALGSVTATSSSAAATAAQLRDFVSGCVGFLIGSPTTPRRS